MSLHSYCAAGLVATMCGALSIGCGGTEPKADSRPASTEAVADTRPAPSVPVTVNAMMVSLVDHASHVLWDAERRAPASDKDWLELEHHAIQLAASGTLIALDGPVQSGIDWAKLPGWTEHARALTDAGMAELTAIRNRDRDALIEANGVLVESCERCHDRFKPALPSEGIDHPYF
jgi:hypothetical protein